MSDWSPTPFHDPGRTRTAERPCWQGTAIVIPPLRVLPAEDPEGLIVEILGPTEPRGTSFGWLSKPLPSASLPWLVAQYRADPERVLVEFFGAPLPLGGRWTAPQQTPASLEDMGL